MILTKYCACGQQIEFEAEELAELTCPACGTSLREQFAPKSARVPGALQPQTSIEAPRPSAPPAQSNLAHDTLDHVRKQSCYKTFRGFIETAIDIGLVILAILIVVPLIVVLQARSGTMVAGGLMFAALAALGFILLVALKQALVLAVDAVDILIADRTDRRIHAAALSAAEQIAHERAQAAPIGE